MKKTKNKRVFLSIFLIILFNAGLLDLKYKGLFYRFFPGKIQSYVDTIWKK